MKTQELNIFREIQRNTENAITTLDTIAGKVFDDQLAMQVSRQSMGYSRLRSEALDQILSARAKPYQSNHWSEMAAKAGVHYNTLLNTSTSRLAELMIRESNNGILEMKRALNHNEEARGKAVALARELIDLEQKNVEQLIPYL